MRWSDDNDDERSSNGLEVVFFRRFWRLQILTTRARSTGSRSSRAPPSVVLAVTNRGVVGALFWRDQ